MNSFAQTTNQESLRIWKHRSREEQILEIQELIVSPYWQYLHPKHRRQWLAQLGELQVPH